MPHLYIQVNEETENIQERAFKRFYNDFYSDYLTLMNKLGKPTRKVKCLQNLATEVFKDIKKITKK